MASLEKGAWALVLAVILISIGLFISEKLGDTAGATSNTKNWSTLAGNQLVDNVTLIGLVFLLVLVGGAFIYIRQIRK